EWPRLAAATRPAPLQPAPRREQDAVHAPPRAPPAGAAAIVLPQPVSAARADPVVAPGWINRQGMRVLCSRFTLPTLDSLLGFVEVAALNALATRIPEQAILDTASTRTLWKIAAHR